MHSFESFEAWGSVNESGKEFFVFRRGNSRWAPSIRNINKIDVHHDNKKFHSSSCYIHAGNNKWIKIANEVNL